MSAEVEHWCTRAFLHEIPKADIHVHLDGSLRLETLVELARKEPSITLPTEDLGELRTNIFKKNFASLEEYLAPFGFTVAVLQNSENLERVAYEFAVDNFEENVRYFENGRTMAKAPAPTPTAARQTGAKAGYFRQPAPSLWRTVIGSRI